MPIWTLQYRRAYKSLIENTIVGGLHLGERHANERGGIATKMSLSVPPHAYFDGPTITFHASFRVVHPREFASPSVSGASPRPVLYSICAILWTVPAWKISIHETPYGHSRDQSCTLYVPGISIRLYSVFDGLGPGFRFWFRAKGCRVSWRFNLYLPGKFTDEFGDLHCIGWPREQKISISNSFNDLSHQQRYWINSSL